MIDHSSGRRKKENTTGVVKKRGFKFHLYMDNPKMKGILEG
jgi:hypothetical protein